MAATAKRLIPQVIQTSIELPPWTALFQNSWTPVSSDDLKEVRRLSQFWPVIVLVPKSSAKDQTLSSGIAANSKVRTMERELPEPLEKVVVPSKRSNPESESAFGEVIVNFSEMTAFRKGQPVTLTALEFKTLKYLIQNARRVISRDELLNEVWGYENYPCTRTVDNHILRLRQKLEREPSRPVHLRTVQRAGYKFLP
jgi:DNA-binding response OmpR family regulator